MAKQKKEKIEKKSGITLNEYLANYSRNRKNDSTIISWYQKKDAKNTRRGKEEWDKIILKFYSSK